MPFPVEAARYSGLRAAKDGVLWLRHPVRGVLGASRATPDDPDPKSELERYDLVQQRIEHLAADADHFAVSGDGKRVLLWTDGKLKVVPSDRRAPNDDDSDANITVGLSRVRQTVDPAAEWRQSTTRRAVSCGTTSGGRTSAESTGTGSSTATGRCSGGWPRTTTWWTSCGRCTANWDLTTRT